MEVVRMAHHLNLFPDLVLLVVNLLILGIAFFRIAGGGRLDPPRRVLLLLSGLLIAAIESLGYLLGFARTWRHIPAVPATWVQAVGLILEVSLLGFFSGWLVWKRAPAYRPPRRQFLKCTGGALAAAPLVATTLGVISRNAFDLREVRIPIPNLPKDLQGLRMVQVTDIHLSPFLTERQFARAIDMANECRAQIVLVTGDLITRLGDPLDACIGQLARLRGDVRLGCMGNHEVYTKTENYVKQAGQRIGIDFLRNEARLLRFGESYLNIAGVDYQQFHTPYLVGAEKLAAPGHVNVLLSHNPDVFPKAVQKGFDLTIAGHTHGGQVNFEILHKNVNVALAFTPYVRGLYQRGDSSIYVSSGLGTIGVPVRIGAPAEVTLIQLCAS